MDRQPLPPGVQFFGQLLHKGSVVIPQLGIDTLVVQVDAGVHLAHHQVGNGLHVGFLALGDDQHVIDQIAAGNPIIGPVADTGQHDVRLLPVHG